MKFLKGLLWLPFEKRKLNLGRKFLMMDRIFSSGCPWRREHKNENGIIQRTLNTKDYIK